MTMRAEMGVASGLVILVLAFSCSTASKTSGHRTIAAVPGDPCQVIGNDNGPDESSVAFFSRQFGLDSSSFKAIARCRQISQNGVQAPSSIDVCLFTAKTTGGRPAFVSTSYAFDGLRQVIAQGDDENGSVTVSGDGVSAKQAMTVSGVVSEHPETDLSFDSSKNTFHFEKSNREGMIGLRHTEEEFTAQCTPGDSH
jgi:hypothetical protein